MGGAINQDWENDPRVEILHVLDEIGQPYSCDEWGEAWGEAGLNGVPIINGAGSTLFNMFEHPGDGSSRPLVVFINHEMEIIYLDDHHISQTDAHALITLMLDTLPPLSIETNINPKEFFIHQLYPNPFNPVLHINFELSLAGLIQIDILDVAGAHIKTLHSGFLKSGSHELSWHAESMPSGLYFISLKLGDKSLTEKVVLLK